MPDYSNKVTIYDVASLAGVSVSSVSRVLHDVKSVKSDVRERVQAAIKELDYVPNRTAQLLKARRSKMLVHIVADIAHPIYISLYRSVREKAEEKGYSVLLIDAQHDSERVRRATDALPISSIDGIILSARTVGKNILQQLKESGLPVVFTNNCDQTLFDASYPAPDLGVRLAIHYLMKEGHRRIAYAGGSNRKFLSQARFEAYKQVLQEAGLPYDCDLSFQMDKSMNAGYRAGMYFASIPHRPTAIITESGELALGVMQALYEKHVRIPDDISLVSGADMRFAVVHPQLTTLSDPADGVAAVAVDFLTDRVEGRYDGPPRVHISQECTLHVHETSGPAPKE